jgi:hypothetical protein
VLNLNQSQTSGKLTKAVELDLITRKEINDWKKGRISDPTYMDGVEEVTFGEQEPPLCVSMGDDEDDYSVSDE